MGKASRKKHVQSLQKATLEKYGNVKLSDAITHLCEPFDSEKLDVDSYKILISMTITAWNIALSPTEEARKEQLILVLETMPDFEQEFERGLEMLMAGNRSQEPPDSIVILRILAELIKRKDELYPNDDRRIVDFQLKPTANGHHLQIKSIIPKRSDD